MLAQVPGEGDSELFRRHTVIGALGQTEQSLGKSALVRSYVATEQDDGAPVGVERRGLGVEVGQATGGPGDANHPSLSFIAASAATATARSRPMICGASPAACQHRVAKPPWKAWLPATRPTTSSN